jgi:hypothetical protein
VRVEIDVLHPLAFLAAVDATGPLWSTAPDGQAFATKARRDG